MPTDCSTKLVALVQRMNLLKFEHPEGIPYVESITIRNTAAGFECTLERGPARGPIVLTDDTLDALLDSVSTRFDIYEWYQRACTLADKIPACPHCGRVMFAGRCCAKR